MRKVDVHELINAPGAGVAESALRAAGCWKDETPDDAPMWKVRVVYSVAYAETLTVQARTEAEAKEAARQSIEEYPDSGRPEHVEISTTKAELDPYAQRADVVAHDDD